MLKIKISQLPLVSSLIGLYTIGVDSQNNSCKVSLEFLNTAAVNANNAAAAANTAATSANTAATNANAANTAANTAAANANTATSGANTARDAANTAANNAQAIVTAWTTPTTGYKAKIESAIAQTEDIIETAEADHTQATADHTTAGTDHTTALADHAASGKMKPFPDSWEIGTEDEPVYMSELIDSITDVSDNQVYAGDVWIKDAPYNEEFYEEEETYVFGYCILYVENADAGVYFATVYNNDVYPYYWWYASWQDEWITPVMRDELNEEKTSRAAAVTAEANARTAAIQALENAYVPTGFDVVAPTQVTLGNQAELAITPVFTPSTVKKNVMFISDNEAVAVTPNGRLTIKKDGYSVVHAVPTLNTALSKSVVIQVIRPAMRLVAADAIRLNTASSIRLK